LLGLTLVRVVAIEVGRAFGLAASPPGMPITSWSAERSGTRDSLAVISVLARRHR